jgi:hypothetical protein
MNILLYSPDNEITNNFMPHLWMFLLKSLTPEGHEVFLVDGNSQRLSETELVQYVREKNIGLVGIGAMTRMIRKAYQMADAVRAAGVPVIMGGRMLPNCPKRLWGVTADLAMPTQWPWGRLTRFGRRLLRTPSGACCRKPMSLWMLPVRQ